MVGDCLAGLGNCLISLDRFEEAEVALLEAHEIMTAWFGEYNDSQIGAVLREIVGLYEDWDRPEQAAAYRARLAAAKEPRDLG